MAKNAYLAKVAMEKRELLNVGIQVGAQQIIDALQLALQEEGYGTDRTYRILKNTMMYREGFMRAFDRKDPEADVFREHLDRALSNLCDDEHPLIAFEERYADLAKITY